MKGRRGLAQVHQKTEKMLRGMITGLSCCTLLSVTLAAAAIANRPNPAPVRFSDIQEGVSVTAAEHAVPSPEAEETVDSEFLYETMYPTELLTESTTALPHTPTLTILRSARAERF